MKKLISQLVIVINTLVVMFYGSMLFATEAVVSIYSEDIVKEKVDLDKWHFYKIEVDTPAKLTVKLRKITDDIDLYVARSKKPTEDDFHCAPQKTGVRIETCRLSSHIPVTWFIGVHGKMRSVYELGVIADELNLHSRSIITN